VRPSRILPLAAILAAFFTLPCQAMAIGIGPDAVAASPLDIAGEIFTVNSPGDDNTPDDGFTTLREAIAQANATPGTDTIVFSGAMAQQTIISSAPYLITESVQIDGYAAPGIKLEITGDSSRELINVSGSISLSIANISLSTRGKGSHSGVVACGNVEFERVAFADFHRALQVCDHTDVSIFASRLENNSYTFVINSAGDVTRFMDIAIDRSIIIDSTTLAFNRLGEIDMHISNSILRGSSSIRVEGTVNLSIVNSSLLNNPDTFIEAKRIFYREYSNQPYQYFDPTVNMTGVTASGNTETIIFSSHADTLIAHSTFYDNLMRDRSNPGYFTSPVLRINHGSVHFDHALITGNTSSGPGISLENTEMTGEFSILPLLDNASSLIELDGTTGLYLGAEFNLAPLEQSTVYPPFHMPLSDSSLISAGNPSAIAGVDGVPTTEQRDSNRIVGDGIEIGAVEFNSPPVLDLDALRDEIDAQFSALSQAGDPEGDIILDMDNFVSDPDGHIINDINLAGDELLAFDTGSHVLSGSRANLLASRDLSVVMEDETGLTGVAAARLSGSGSSGGPLPLFILLLAGMLLPMRRH
jgi:hypothetical protein